jgi:hypothetical protein
MPNLKLIAIAAAMALPVSATFVAMTDISAEAATKAKKPAKAKSATAQAKSCGEFMYRKGGKCVDAREKKAG